MDENPKTQSYETVFCIFLVLLAFLWRENPNLIYPQILYLLLLLLTLNLAAALSLRFWPTKKWISAGIILANCATITSILSYSGDYASNLWVLFLLPIYTGCILLDQRETVLVTCGVLCFNLTFYVLNTSIWDAAVFFELAVKSGVFVFAAGATWGIVKRGRANAARLRAQRRQLVAMEDQIKEQEARANETQKITEVGWIASGVAHDLKSPLTVILGTVHLLMQDETFPANLRGDLDRIVRATDLCSSIATNLLLKARDGTFSPVPCDVLEIINSTLSLYEKTLSDSHIIVEKKFVDAPVPQIRANRLEIQRLLLNLFSNARGAMKNGGTLKISVGLIPGLRSGAKPQVNIEVEDTGPGIASDVLPRLFQPFNTNKPTGEGTGLGLYLCREIAIKHAGVLTAKNAPGGGACFVLTLPTIEPAPVSAKL